MNVLFLTKYNVVRAGVAEVLQALARALRPLGVNVSIYSSDASAAVARLPEGTACAHGPLPKPGLLTGRKALSAIVETARRWEIDLVHAHGLYRPGWAARLLSQATGLPYVVTSHGDILTGLSRRARRGSFRRRCGLILRDAAAATHLTDAIAAEALALADVADKSVVIPNGVDLTWWRRPAKPVAGRYVLALGRFVAQKGFDVLLGAWPGLRRRGSDVSLVLAGEGPMEEDLRAHASELHLTVGHSLAELSGGPRADVVFPGFVDGEAKRNLFAGAQAVAFPSLLAESFGIVLLEAMAAGRPLVTTDFPSTRAIVTDQHARFVPPGDAAALCEAIWDVLSDPRAGERSAESCPAAVERYDWSHIAARYAEVYRRAVAGG